MSWSCVMVFLFQQGYSLFQHPHLKYIRRKTKIKKQKTVEMLLILVTWEYYPNRYQIIIFKYVLLTRLAASSTSVQCHEVENVNFHKMLVTSSKIHTKIINSSMGGLSDTHFCNLYPNNWSNFHSKFEKHQKHTFN